MEVNFCLSCGSALEIREIEGMNVAPFTRWLVDVAVQAKSVGLVADEQPIVPLAGNVLFRI